METRLTVIREERFTKNGYNVRGLLCSCECGAEPRVYRYHSVVRGETRSCGCLNSDMARARGKLRTVGPRQQGRTGTHRKLSQFINRHGFLPAAELCECGKNRAYHDIRQLSDTSHEFIGTGAQ